MDTLICAGARSPGSVKEPISGIHRRFKGAKVERETVKSPDGTERTKVSAFLIVDSQQFPADIYPQTPEQVELLEKIVQSGPSAARTAVLAPRIVRGDPPE